MNDLDRAHHPKYLDGHLDHDLDPLDRYLDRDNRLRSWSSPRIRSASRPNITIYITIHDLDPNNRGLKTCRIEPYPTDPTRKP